MEAGLLAKVTAGRSPNNWLINRFPQSVASPGPTFSDNARTYET